MSETHFWHPFANMAHVRRGAIAVARGEGCWVWDTDGRRYLDATASLWYVNVGHGRKEIVEAMARQAGEIAAYSTFGDFTNSPVEVLARRIAAHAPDPSAKVFFGSGGGDAIETAVKVARAYWAATGDDRRTHVISRDRSYHGTHGFGTSLAGIGPNRAGFGPLDLDQSQVAWDSPEALGAEIERLGAERVAAFFCEPVIGAGGVYPPPAGYLESVAEICRGSGVLLVIDAVICGFGRVGDWLAAERWGLHPDLVTFAKGVTSGYLPLGGVVVSGRIAAPFWDGEGRMFRHGATYAGHPTVCAAALANLDIHQREGLVARGREMECALHGVLEPLAAHPAVAEVRGGVGLLGAVELAPDLLAERPAAVAELQVAVRDAGVLVRGLGSSIAVSPPLVIDDEQIKAIATGIAAGLEVFA
ncbi:MAG: aminotransferase family protein [Acidimicrobiales bacterium]